MQINKANQSNKSSNSNNTNTNVSLLSTPDEQNSLLKNISAVRNSLLQSREILMCDDDVFKHKGDFPLVFTG